MSLLRGSQKLASFRQLEKQIKSTVQDLEVKRKAHLKVEFNKNRDDDQEEAEINDQQSEIDGLFKESEKQIKELDSAYVENLDDDDATNAELSIIRNVKMCLISEITALSKTYRDNQRRYISDVKKKANVRDLRAGGDLQRKAEENMKMDAEVDGYLQSGMCQEEIDSIMLNRQMADDRIKEFQKIYQSIAGLRDMFKDLNDLVIDQGTVLDRIDHNMNLTHQRVTEGVKELKQAQEIQQAGTYKLCVMFLIVLIIGFLLALMFKIA